MKKSTIKLVGICAATLLTVSAISPTVSTVVGETGTAQAEDITNGYLAKEPKYEVGTFTDADFELLSGQTTSFEGTDVLGTAPLDAPVIAQLFPGMPPVSILEALGLSQYPGYSVEMKSNRNFANLYALNQYSGPIGITFTVKNSEGAIITNISTTLQVQNYQVNVEDIVANLGDKYTDDKNISAYNPYGVKMDVEVGTTIPHADFMAPNTLYVAVATSQPANYFSTNLADGYVVEVNNNKYFNKLLSQKVPQQVIVSYLTGNGQRILNNETRYITVNATAETTPILQVKTKNGPFANTEVYYSNGQKVSTEYAYQMDALNQAPLGGADDYIKNNLWGSTVGADPSYGFLINNDNNTNTQANVDKRTTKLVLTPFAGSKGGDVASLYSEYSLVRNPNFNDWNAPGDEDVSIDASKVDFTTPGTYYYTVSVTNAQNVTADFELPLIIKATKNAPTYKFSAGHSADMTIKQGDTFKPFEGLTFYQNDAQKETITQDNITVEGSVNTNVPGTYKLVYTATNNIGLTVSVTRTITVTGTSVEAQPIAVYRAYNPNNGDHLYTTDAAEFRNVVGLGWHDEGVAWEALKTQSTGAYPVYRVYNPNSGEHFYTAEKTEYDNLEKAGWKQEGIAFFSAAKDGGMSVYRAFNPNAKGPGSHIFTTDKAEYQNVIKAGWRAEGTAFYGFQ